MRTDHEIFIEKLVLQEQTTIKVSLQDMASIYLPSDTKPFIQQKLATNTYHIMVLLQRALHKDSRTSRFSILRISYEFLLNFKVHC